MYRLIARVNLGTAKKHLWLETGNIARSNRRTLKNNRSEINALKYIYDNIVTLLEILLQVKNYSALQTLLLWMTNWLPNDKTTDR
jgi:hypothetical protein